MREAKVSSTAALRKRATILLVCITIALATALPVGAQSGRRIPKAKPSEGVQPPADPEPPVAPPEEKPDTPKTSLLLVHYLPNITTTSYYTDLVKHSCAKRLSEASTVKVSVGGEMNRGEAQNRAKSGTEAYVIWLQLQNDYGDPDTLRRTHPAQLFVNFIVYKPETGKVQTQGNVYQRRRGVLPQYQVVEESLREAGREMADRILDSLNILKPSRPRI